MNDGEHSRERYPTNAAHGSRGRENLLYREHLYRLFETNTKDVVWTSDLNLNWTYVSSSIEQLQGYTAEEYLTRPFNTLMTPTSAALVQDTLAKTLRAIHQDPPGWRDSRAIEVELLCRDGSTVWVEVRYALLRNDAGKPIGFIGVSRDIDDRKRAKELLRKSEQQYRQFVETTSDCVWKIDENAVFTYASPKLKSLLGYEPREVFGKTPFDLMRPDEAKRARDLFGPIAARHLPIVGMETTNVHRDGHLVITEISAVPIFEEHGGFLGYQGCAQDVTDRKRVEKKLRDYATTLESVNRELETLYHVAESATKIKSEFLANMSHEIRTPMTAILGYAEVLLGNLGASEDIEIVQTIHRNGEFLLEIINDILDLSKIEAGRLVIESTACTLRPLLDDVFSLMRIRVEAKPIALEMKCIEPLPDTIRTDPIRLRQILLNLIGNAIKFTESGQVRVTIDIAEVRAGHAVARFRISDTGVGIAPDQMGRLFQPFSQGNATTTRRFGGTGLGLAISKRLAQMLGGDITVCSAPGKGSTFTLTVDAGPVVEFGPDHPAETSVISKAPGEFSSPATSLPCRVLLVEDGLDNQRLISLVLRKAGADVMAVENGRMALDLVEESLRNGRPFDVILMDMQMPVMDGYEATRRLRADGYDAPIIALTAHVMTGDREKCLSAGCNDYISKPINRMEFIETITRNIKKPSETATASATCSTPPSP